MTWRGIPLQIPIFKRSAAMIQFENNLIIKRPVAEVFAFVSDFTNMPKWNYFVLEVKKVNPGPVGLGTTYFQVRKTDSQQFAITEYEPSRVVTIKTMPPAPALEMRFTFETLGSNTRLTDTWALETGRHGFFEWLATGRVRSAVAENLGKLKQLLEVGEVYLQDGKRVAHN
jgi:hypothetical protein